MPDLFDNTEGLDDIGAILARMAANCPHPRSTSRSLWKLRRATNIAAHSRRPEIMLEKSVAILANNGRMPEWFNQCSVASGIGGSEKYKRSCSDLIHWSASRAFLRLVELKWERDKPRKTQSDHSKPVEALRQVLRYGAAYIFCRLHRAELPLEGRSLMDARHIGLEVIAPAYYYRDSAIEKHLTQMREHLKKFETESRIPELSISLNALAFPDNFDAIPFANGGEVKKLCGGNDWTTQARRVREAFENLQTGRSA